MLNLFKKFKISISIIAIFIASIFLFGENFKDSIKISLNDNNVIKYKFFKDLVKVLKDPRYIMNDYNVNFLPETQFLNFNNYKFKINKEAKYPHFIEIIDEKILIISNDFNFYSKNIEDINYKKKDLRFEVIRNNLKDLNIKNILDTKFYDGKLFVSYKNIIDENCVSVSVSYSTFNLEYLNFSKLFSINECAKGNIWGGAIDIYKTENDYGLLLSTSDVLRSRDEDTSIARDNRAQDDNSLYNKILFFNFDTNQLKIFSKGHRNPGSIFIDKNIIISTEHGPRGGDEINLIKKNGNYGWPISSYGDLYFSKKKNPYYKKDHKKYGFIEPIYSFVPSIGISCIIKVPDGFDEYWQDNYLIASLYGNSIYRVKFDNKYSKILFSEKIFIGERIRDLKFYKNLIILSFESGLSLGILEKN